MAQGGQILTPKFDTGSGRLFVGDGNDYPDIVNFNENDGVVQYKTNPDTGGVVYSVNGKPSAGYEISQGGVKQFSQPPAANAIRLGSDLTNWVLGNSGTAATAVIDSDSPLGFPAIRVDIPNGNTYAQLTTTGLSVPGYGGAVGNLTWCMYVEEPALISQFQSIVGDAGFVQSDTTARVLAGSDKYNHGGLHVFGHKKTLAFSVTDARIRIFGNAVTTGNVGRVWLYLMYIPQPVKPSIILTFDDADISFYTKVLPSLKLRGLHATFAINKNDVGTNPSLYCSESQLGAIYSAGNDFSSHNLTNTNAVTQGAEAYLADFDTCLSWLRSKGWVRGNGYHAFVQGKHYKAVCDGMIDRGVAVMRNATSTDLIPVGYTALGQSVLMPIAASLSSTTTLAAAKAKIDEAIGCGYDVCFMGHIISSSAGAAAWAEDDWLALLDYALLKRAQGLVAHVGSVTEWAALRGLRSMS